MKLHGSENFYMEIIACSKDEIYINFMERLLIQEYNTISPNGYNIHIGGNGGNVLLPTQIVMKDIKTRKMMVVEKTDPRIISGELINKRAGKCDIKIDEKTYNVEDNSEIYDLYQKIKSLIKKENLKDVIRQSRTPKHRTTGMVNVTYIENLERKKISIDHDDIKNGLCFKTGSEFIPVTDGKLVYGSITDAARKIKRDPTFVRRRVEEQLEGWRYVILPFQNDPAYGIIKPATSR